MTSLKRAEGVLKHAVHGVRHSIQGRLWTERWDSKQVTKRAAANNGSAGNPLEA
jgi:hypothetical protein